MITSQQNDFIEIKGRPITLRNQKIESGEWILQLHNRYVFYTIDVFGEEPVSEEQDDHTLGWEETRAHEEITCLKEHVFGINFSYREIKQSEQSKMPHCRNYWSVNLVCRGPDITIYFHSETVARSLYEQVNKWLLTT